MQFEAEAELKLRAVRSAMDPAVQIFQSLCQPSLILFPGHPVHSRAPLSA